MKFRRSWYRKAVSTALTMSLVFSTAMPTANAAEADDVTFARDADGRPIFNGIAADMDAFIDVIFDDMTLREKAIYAVHRYADGGLELAAGYMLPDGKGEVDAVQGVYTDFPTMNALGQSWNLDLLNRVGDVIGDERRGDLANYSGMTAMYSVVGDIRSNPLSGRYEEDFSEDPDMVGDMISSMGDGIIGNGETGNEDGFWLKVGLGTKHYANYAAQWFRKPGSFYTSLRALYEQQLKGFKEAVENGSVVGVMTSYGRTNGVPNAASPSISIIEDANTDYTLWNVADFMGEDSLTKDSGNNYDAVYCPDAAHAAALLILSGTTENAMGGTAAKGGTADSISESSDARISPNDVVRAVEEGIWGVTEEDLEESIRGLFEMFVRTGCFNPDEDEDGKPDGYVFADLALGENEAVTAAENKARALADEASQTIALQSAQEAVVLLKNEDDVLPLKKSDFSSEDPLMVYGTFADARFKSVYSASTPNVENSGLTPLSGIRTLLGDVNAQLVSYDAAEETIALKSKANGQYVTVSDNAGIMTLQSAESLTDNQLFRSYAWGQMGYSFKSVLNDLWVKRTSVTTGSGWGATTTYTGTIENTGTEQLSIGENVWNENGTATSSSMPERFRLEENEDGTVSLVAGSYAESFGGGFETVYNTSAKIISTGEFITTTSTAMACTSSAALEVRADAVKFDKEVIAEAGAEITVNEDGYAVVVVGIPTKHSAGEGADRSDLAMGQEQYDLVANVAARYPGKTIVIVKADSPVLMEEIQDNDDVAAIVYQPYAGQYDGYALAQVLFGDVNPSGHLTGTWYDSMDVLPEIKGESLPEGEGMTLDDVDPRFTVDYTNNDPIDMALTYMYHGDSDITYPFGYGLTYSTFDYEDLSVPSQVEEGDVFEATATITNTSDIPGSTVVQIYAEPRNSAYGDAIYDKKLIGYAKVELEAGESRTVSIECDTDAMAIYDVNGQTLIVEDGIYDIFLGESSADEQQSRTMSVEGSEVQAARFENAENVFEHVFQTSNVKYYEVSKAKTAAYNGGYYAVSATESGIDDGDSWVGLSSVDMSNAKEITARLATASSEDAAIEVRLDSPEGELLTVFTTTDTGSVTGDISYIGQIEAASMETYSEMAYTEVTGSIEASVSGVHDLYLVFTDDVSRIDTLQIRRAPEVTATSTRHAVSMYWPQIEGENYTVYQKNGDLYNELTGLVQNVADGRVMVNIGDLNSGTTYQFRVTASNESTTLSTDATIKTRSNESSESSSGGSSAEETENASPDDGTGATEDGNSNADQQEEHDNRVLSPYRDFASVPSWAKTYLSRMVESGILAGTEQGDLRPTASATRAEFCKMIVLALKLEATDETTNFKDVVDGDWFENVVGIASSNGLINGIGNRLFNPEGEISRQDVAVIVQRALAAKGIVIPAAAHTQFTDETQIADYALDAVYMLQEMGIYNGYEDGSVRPQAPISRSELAKVLALVMDYLSGEAQ